MTTTGLGLKNSPPPAPNDKMHIRRSTRRRDKRGASIIREPHTAQDACNLHPKFVTSL